MVVRTIHLSLLRAPSYPVRTYHTCRLHGYLRTGLVSRRPCPMCALVLMKLRLTQMGGCHLHSQRTYSPEIQKAIEGVQFIAQHIKDADRDNEVIQDWKYVAMVLDRLFLWVFTIACVAGTCGIIFQAPSLYDTRRPIDQIYSEIGKNY
ncbi:hypothetical protein Pcinc_033686 [Petrolisthes cinctipes]|uniref:Neurotransmitter-gated ion-channel transmembrane domain-containing protein n=1 Tax=Petrolisthes cinctipes TaxID=88211 RepID=A0AAE1ERX9_PETCI|nr:hypothetical protein Pcinc_033686 [Petrolisthes cinctipes]